MNALFLKIALIQRHLQRNMTSGLAYIDMAKNCEPFDLFRNWIEDFKKHTTSNLVVFNLATSSDTGYVKNRHIVLQELADNGLIFNTVENSPKARQIAENSKVAASFIFQYAKDNLPGVSRQIRIEGVAEKLPREVSERLFNSQPLFSKIRCVLIREQGVEVQWDDLKRKHDELLEKVTQGETELKMPDYIVAYKIVPKQFDFYHSAGEEIADRVFFKESATGSWSWYHITA